MPTRHSIPLCSELYAISLIDFEKKSIRAVADTVGVPKSTLHDNLVKYRTDVAAFEKREETFERLLVRNILSLSYEGKTSSRDCAKVVSRLTGQYVSHQKVLSVLQKTAKVAHTKNNEKIKLKFVQAGDDLEVPPLTYVQCAAFDEIFQKQNPILGFVDPISSFVYIEAASDRSEKSWTEFLKKLLSLGLTPNFSITDGGQGMLKALKQIFPQAGQFRDLFHVLQKLSKALRAFEGYCYGLIAAHDRGAKNSENAFNVSTIKTKMDEAIQLFDTFEKETKALQQACYFENSEGYVNSNQTRVIIDCIVDIIASAELKGIKHKAIRASRTYLSGAKNNIVAYKENIEYVVRSQFGEIYATTVLGYICPIVEYLDQIQRSYENSKRRSYWVNKVIEARSKFRKFNFIDQTEVDQAIDGVAKIMGGIKKSNSLIEAINSVIRRHLTTYKSIPTWFCPIFTFYWNHRTFERGKRRGLKPREILTGKHFEQDWIEVLLNEYPFAATESPIENLRSLNVEAA